MSTPHDYYYKDGYDPHLYSRGNNRHYVEPDYFGIECDDQLPMVSTLGAGPRGAGVYPVVTTDESIGQTIVHFFDDVENKEIANTGNIHAGHIYITAPDEEELREGQTSYMTVHTVLGGVTTSVDVPIPAGSHGSRIYLIDANPYNARQDRTYSVGIDDLTLYGYHAWSHFPGPRPCDIVCFTLNEGGMIKLAFGTIQEIIDKTVIFTCRTTIGVPVPTLSENETWIVNGIDTGISAKGPQGDPGPQGETGRAVDIQGGIWAYEDLPPFDETPVGLAFIVDDGDGRYDLYVRGVLPYESELGGMWTVVEDWEGKPAVIKNVNIHVLPSDQESYCTVSYTNTQKENQYDLDMYLALEVNLDDILEQIEQLSQNLQNLALSVSQADNQLSQKIDRVKAELETSIVDTANSTLTAAKGYTDDEIAKLDIPSDEHITELAKRVVPTDTHIESIAKTAVEKYGISEEKVSEVVDEALDNYNPKIGRITSIYLSGNKDLIYVYDDGEPVIPVKKLDYDTFWNASANYDATKIIFSCNEESLPAGTDVSDDHSGELILTKSGTEYTVHSLAAKIKLPNNCTSLFNFVDELVGLEYVDTSEVITMFNMFYNCSNLISVDLSAWNVSKCESFQEMFNGCTNLISVGDLSSWDTSNCTNFTGMFLQCANLSTAGDITNWPKNEDAIFTSMFGWKGSVLPIAPKPSWWYEV